MDTAALLLLCAYIGRNVFVGVCVYSVCVCVKDAGGLSAC